MEINDNKLLVWKESIENQRHFNEIKNSILKNFLYFCTIIVASFVLLFKFLSVNNESFGNFYILGFNIDYVFLFLNALILISSAFLHKYMNYSKMLTSVSKYLIYLEKKLDDICLSTAISISVPSKGFTHIFNPISIFIAIIMFLIPIVYGLSFESYNILEIIIILLSTFYYLCFVLMVIINSILFKSKNKVNRYLTKDLTFILLENIKEKDFSMNKFEDGIKIWFSNNEIHKVKDQKNYLKFALINLEERGDIVFDRCLWFKSLRAYRKLKNFKIIKK